MTIWMIRFASRVPSGGKTSASCNVARTAIDAPIGPDIFALTDDAMPMQTNKPTKVPIDIDVRRAEIFIARIIQKARRGCQQADDSVQSGPKWNHLWIPP